MKYNTCAICGIIKLDRDNKTRKFCSRKCRYKSQENKPAWNKGKKTPLEVRQKQSKRRLGKEPWNKNKFGYRLKEGTGIRISAALQGIPVSEWKGHKTPQILALRMSSDYKIWRRAVFKRDNYSCQKCGQVGGKLNADHIKPFAFFPDSRFDLKNGRTLCEKCHLKTETFGFKAKTYVAQV